MAHSERDCFPRRVALAGERIERGEWASGHAIASGLLQCALRGGCLYRGDCASAANTLLCHLRSLLAH